MFEKLKKLYDDNKSYVIISVMLLFAFGTVAILSMSNAGEKINQECCDDFCNEMLSGAGVCNHYTEVAMFCKYNETLMDNITQARGTTPVFEFLVFNSTKACPK
jgi:hypothetical protein